MGPSYAYRPAVHPILRYKPQGSRVSCMHDANQGEDELEVASTNEEARKNLNGTRYYTGGGMWVGVRMYLEDEKELISTWKWVLVAELTYILAEFPSFLVITAVKTPCLPCFAWPRPGIPGLRQEIEELYPYGLQTQRSDELFRSLSKAVCRLSALGFIQIRKVSQHCARTPGNHTMNQAICWQRPHLLPSTFPIRHFCWASPGKMSKAEGKALVWTFP